MPLTAHRLTARPLTAERLIALRLGEDTESLALALRDESNQPLLDESGALLLEEPE